MSGEMVTVFRANSVDEAHVVANWLEEQGIPAFVKNELTARLYVQSIPAPLGIEVCVADDESAETARALLAEHKAEQDRQPDPYAPYVDAVCEDCGGASHFPAHAAGTVQSCPHCKHYIDVPEI